MVDDSRDGAVQASQAFVAERWAVAQPQFYPDVSEAPRVHPELTPREAADFLRSVAAHRGEPPMFEVDDDRVVRSDRFPPKSDGSPGGFHFFEWPGRLRLETIVHMAAMARLRDEFGWPREHLVFESPAVEDESGRASLQGGAVDILLLKEPCFRLPPRMTRAAAQPRVAIEVKADRKRLDGLVREIRTCRAATVGYDHQEHKKCALIDFLRPARFAGVAAGEYWRVFNVASYEGRYVVADELPRLDDLAF